jgi:putative PIN family toxin of toxin-antitoxin system
MMRVVLDTNVLVSGVLSEAGPPGWILDMVLAGDLEPAYDNRILLEYREVLSRREFGFSPALVGQLLEAVELFGFPVTAPPWPQRLPDPADEPFLAAALASGAHCLITGNTRHFPAKLRGTVKVLTPREFLEGFKEAVK